MSDQMCDLLSGLQVPQSCRIVVGAGNDTCPVPAEAHDVNALLMSCKRSVRISCSDLEDANVLANGGCRERSVLIQEDTRYVEGSILVGDAPGIENGFGPQVKSDQFPMTVEPSDPPAVATEHQARDRTRGRKFDGNTSGR